MSTVYCPAGCTAPDKGRLLEDYLSGELTEAQATAFEGHYFECSVCLDAIRVRQSGPYALGRWDQTPRTRMRVRLGLIAASLVVGATLYVLCGSGVPNLSRRNPAATLADASRVTAPQYVPSIAGGSDDEPRRRFVDAMQTYSAGDPGGAIPGLEASWTADSSRPETGFFLGASYLVTNRVDRAIETFGTTVALGASPFRERSKILLAKAYLRREAMDDARRELREVAARGGELHDEAERLLDAMERVAKR